MILSNVKRFVSLYFSELDCLDFPAFSSPNTKTTQISELITIQLNHRARALEETTIIILKWWQTHFPADLLFSGVVYEWQTNVFERQTYREELNDV